MRGQLVAVGGVLRNGALFRLELAWGGYWVVDWASLVALSVWAYRSGGAEAVGVVGLLRMLPAAFALPVGAAVTDRFPRDRVLASVYGAEAVLLGLAGWAVAWGSSTIVVYGVVVLMGVCAAPCRPAQLSLTPLLARSPDELVAANATAMVFEGVATILGPLLAGLLLAVSGVAATLAAVAAISAASAVLVGGIGATADPTRAARHASEPILATLGGGLQELRRLPEVAALIAAFCAQTLVRGMLNVYVVVLALATLSLGDGGVGVLNAAFGVGVMVGALAATSLARRRRLSRSFAFGLSLWGLPLVAAAVWPQTGVVLGAMAVAGVGNAVLDVSGFTLIQRLVDDRLLGRVFGVMYMGVIATVGLGSILAPLLINALGLRPALALSGLLLPAIAVAVYRWIGVADKRTVVPSARLDLIAAFPLFAPMPPLSLEKLARSATDLHVAAGTTLINQGEHGDTFYLLTDGTLTVTADTRLLGRLSAGDGFGEIALLRNVPRTATIKAQTDATLLVIHRADFLAAILGSPESTTTANSLIAARTEPSNALQTIAMPPTHDTD